MFTAWSVLNSTVILWCNAYNIVVSLELWKRGKGKVRVQVCGSKGRVQEGEKQKKLGKE